MATDSLESLFDFYQRKRKPASCLISLGAKASDAAYLPTRIEERIFNRIGTQQVSVERVGNIETLQSDN